MESTENSNTISKITLADSLYFENRIEQIRNMVKRRSLKELPDIIDIPPNNDDGVNREKMQKKDDEKEET